MYDTNNHQDGHCLSYYHSTDSSNFRGVRFETFYTKEIRSYCFRSATENDSTVIFNFQHSTDANFTFAELRQKNITSQMLLSWSASIDIAEQYQIFLNNYSNTSSKNETIFYNCTSSWFGPFCRFKFDYPSVESFKDMVDFIFSSKPPLGEASPFSVGEDPKITCYIHLTCRTLLSCLDWREICDRKQDCLDGADEKNCWQLEINQCDDNEYRCSNGQCIPIEFFRDNEDNPDCLDRTDEEPSFNGICYGNPHFECEEHTCRPGEQEFPCGDGQCINEISICYNGRHNFLPSDFCSNATLCSRELYYLLDIDDEWCASFCSETDCVKDNCPNIFEFRNFPPLFGHVRVMVSNTEIDSDETRLPDYVCYDVMLCPHFSSSTTHFNNLTCHHFHDLELQHVYSHHDLQILVINIKDLFRKCLVTANEIHYCNHSAIYQCENSSKCISKYRLLDGIRDCPFNDDETYNQSCSLNDIHQRFKCIGEESERCFSLLANQNGNEECKYGEDEYSRKESFVRTYISFQMICDDVLHLSPFLINGKNETDETGCELWPCNNTYSRCDGLWLCKNGADEINCPPVTCLDRHHSCIFPNDTSKVSCLPIARAGNDIDDCLGGTDERTKYRGNIQWIDENVKVTYQFHCLNDTKTISFKKLCDKTTDCLFNDDEEFCTIRKNLDKDSCRMFEEDLTEVEYFFCQIGYDSYRWPLVYFKLHNVLAYPLRTITDNTLIAPSIQAENRLIEKDLRSIPSSNVAWLCNRGVPIRLRINDNTSILSCLCPPSYYGDKCQYQNQRVSLSFQILTTSDWRNIFIFLITLIDNEKHIHSYDHIEFLSIRDCRTKFNIYLLYSTRPKNFSKTYSVQIDAFNGLTWTYRGSWIFPLRFSFLPVHRLAVLLRVPFSNLISAQQICSSSCIHGQCFHYVNDAKWTFCQCEPGWSGVQCDVEYKCDCAPGSLCISNSICLCPTNRFGARCHLFRSICDVKSCMNDGQCASLDARDTSSNGTSSMCICSEGYVGDHCEHQQNQTQIDISFHRQVTISSFILVHLITVQKNLKHNRTSIARKLQFDQYSLTLYTSTSFNIAIAQMFNQYYLIILHEQTIALATISTEVIPSYRCQSIGELFNETFTKQHLLKRIKYYHVPCREHQELVCFYDDVHFCLCTLDRSANCFEFDHNMKYECEKYKYCGNGGQCFQDYLECPTSSFCACHQCYFGSQCQFSTKVSALSLDIILGYHIRSNNKINQQSNIVKVAIALTTIIFAFGITNSFLSFQTFRVKETRNIGCGLYLFMSSIISLIIIVLLVLKFAFLVASQVGSIHNRLFLQIQCVLMNFLLRCLLSVSDWLSACVAIERVVNVTQGIKFNKRKSKQMAKWIILIVLVFTSCSYIYDPVYRRLMDDEEEQRTWCLTELPLSVQVFDSILNIFHFSVPFAINAISALIVIIMVARTRSTSQKSKSFKEHLHEQLHHHKHLLISPLILVVLALPRLVLSFLSGCMGSARDSWFYLIGYYVSFMPSIMTFAVFVLPSEVYKKEFAETMKGIWRR